MSAKRLLLCFGILLCSLLVLNGSLAGESENLIDQIRVVGTDPGKSEDCVSMTMLNLSAVPIGAITIRVFFLDRTSNPFWSTTRTWTHDGKYSENLEMEKGPFLSHSVRRFEVCGSDDMQVMNWDRPKVQFQLRDALRYVDLAKFDSICEKIKACDKNKQSQMLLNQPQACQKMFSSMYTGRQTNPMFPNIQQCIQTTPCDELDTFKCFSKATLETPPEVPNQPPELVQNPKSLEEISKTGQFFFSER